MLRYVLITGKGRSGTTWLAQILNSHPDCCYKHEPFPAWKHAGYAAWRDDLAEGEAGELRTRFEALCRGCDHPIDLPPFPPKSYRRQSARVLHALHGLGTRVKALRGLYEWYGRPGLPEGGEVLIKDVNFDTTLLPRLCDVLEPRLIAAIRNPFANIASHLNGVSMGVFEDERARDAARVRELIAAPGGESYRAYQSELTDMPAAMFEAVRWRTQVEPLVAVAERYGRSYVVVYEDLCNDPHAETERIFAFLDWTMTDQTREFVEASIAGEQRARTARRAYFSVYRDPRQSLNKWREQLTSAQQGEIAEIIRDSPLRDRWADLPL